MKKSIIAVLFSFVTLCVVGQVEVTGDVAFYTKNLSTATGIMFSEDPAMVVHMNMNTTTWKGFTLSAAYSGHMGMQRLQDGDHFHMLDLSCGYSFNKEISACVGYELTYTDAENDQIGHGVFAMATYTKRVVSSTFIFFADPSFDVKVGKNVSVYALGGYTNTNSNPWYGLVGIKYSKGSFFTGTYWMFDKSNPGPCACVGLTF